MAAEMQMTESTSNLAEMLRNAEIAEKLGDPNMAGIISRLGVRNYVRIAREIASAVRGPVVLDWGAGFGQMTYLLKRSGMSPIAYDIGSAFHDRRLPIMRELDAVLGGDPIELPFRDERFDCVLSCGVLEHVPDEKGSLSEIRRVLKVDGRLFIYNLPQLHSYKEFVIRKLQLGYAHERCYTALSVKELLNEEGFRVVRVRRGGFLPHLLSGLSPGFKKLYGSAAPVLFPIDRLFSRIPVLNRLAEALEVVALKC